MQQGARRQSYSSDSGVLPVWTDGACIDNGNAAKARGGFGVWFGNQDERNCSGPLPPSENFRHTNQRAELFAIKRALEVTQDDPRDLLIKSDSNYSMQCVTDWLPNWRRHGFSTANNTPVKNRDLIESIDNLIQERGPSKVKFEFVKGRNVPRSFLF